MPTITGAANKCRKCYNVLISEWHIHEDQEYTDDE
jgi:hypothetical protein